MIEVENLRALLAEAREELFDCGAQSATSYERGDRFTMKRAEAIAADLHARIAAALAATETPESHAVCEFCKGRGTVPAKKPWSPSDVLGGDDGR